MLDVIYIPIPIIAILIMGLCFLALVVGLFRMLVEYWMDLYRVRDNRRWYAEHPEKQPEIHSFKMTRTEKNKLWFKTRSFAVLLVMSVMLGLILLGYWLSIK